MGEPRIDLSRPNSDDDGLLGEADSELGALGETLDADLIAGGAAAPAPFSLVELAPSSRVPLFKPSLRLDHGDRPGIMHVQDPAIGKRATLYDFEISIARMLDGKRRAAEVVKASGKLGIPVDLAGLNKFLRQLDAYGFLSGGTADDPKVHGGEGLWPQRRVWDEETRTLYQTGLRLMRHGRRDEAASYFEAVLDADPGNPDATTALARLRSGENLQPGKIGARAAFSLSPNGEPAAHDSGASAKTRGRTALAVLALVLTLAATAFVVGRRGASPPTLAAPDSTAPVAVKLATPPPTLAALPALPAARDASVPPAAPQPTEATPTSEAPLNAPAPTRAALARRRWHPTLAKVIATGPGILQWQRRTTTPVVRGEDVGRINAVKKAAGPTAAAANKKVADLEQLAKTDPVYNDFLESARRDLRALSIDTASATAITAPAAGLLELVAKMGAAVQKGDVLAHIVDDGKWQVEAVLDGSLPARHSGCEIIGDTRSDSVACELVDTRLEAARPVVIVNASGKAPWLLWAKNVYVRLGAARDR